MTLVGLLARRVGLKLVVLPPLVLTTSPSAPTSASACLLLPTVWRLVVVVGLASALVRRVPEAFRHAGHIRLRLKIRLIFVSLVLIVNVGLVASVTPVRISRRPWPLVNVIVLLITREMSLPLVRTTYFVEGLVLARNLLNGSNWNHLHLGVLALVNQVALCRRQLYVGGVGHFFELLDLRLEAQVSSLKVLDKLVLGLHKQDLLL